MSDDDCANESGFVKFPAIGHLKGLYREVPFVKLPDSIDLHQIEYEGTVKLHGSHFDLVSANPSAELQAQSRNRILTVESDNCGFAKFVNKHADSLKDIIKKIRERSGGEHVVIAGEICGKGVQTGVGISNQVEKFIVILNVKVDLMWQPVDVWEDLSNEPNQIYNIRKFTRFHVTIDMTDTMTSLDEVEKLTKEVGADCPVAAALGTPGTGEGIVWIPKNHEVGLQSRLWFKSKTEEHMVTPARNKDPKPVSDATLAAIEFVDDNLTPARLQQGLDYLREFNMESDMKHLGHFLRWLAEDAIKESGQGLDPEVVKASKKIIANRGRMWYKERNTE